MFDGSDDVLDWAGRELRRPVATDPACKARIMECVRAEAPHRRRAGMRRRPGARTGWASPLVQLGLAAGIAGLIAMSALRPLTPSRAIGGTALGPTVLGDSVVNTLRDTLRFVRFMFVDPAASRVALVGDFNDWGARATPLVPAESTGVWSVAVALAPGRHRYAFVVDDTQWVADPSAFPLPHQHGARRTSVVTVTANPD
ncbi:MAG TPA: hypothetical protein VF166_15520 [Gemmatimonadaceae bacterium]